MKSLVKDPLSCSSSTYKIKSSNIFAKKMKSFALHYLAKTGSVFVYNTLEKLTSFLMTSLVLNNCAHISKMYYQIQVTHQ